MSNVAENGNGNRKLVKTKMIGIRVSPDEFDALKHEAESRRLTMSQYMIDVALNRLDHSPNLDDQLATINERLRNLESATWGDPTG